jgi:flagellin-like hook-associated protein FlgL
MISINVNPAASGAGLNLGKANDALQKSLSRLSSGRRIVTSSDDAGGLAVSMKMAAAQKRTEATAINLRNMVSYLDTQDGAFKVADKVLSRMSELTALSRDVSKNAGDVENYNKEFGNLKLQLASLATEKFNGVALFDSNSATGAKFSVPTSEDGTQNTTVSQSPLASDKFMDMMINGFKSFNISGRNFVADIDASTTDTMVVYELPSGAKYDLDISQIPMQTPTDENDYSSVDLNGVYTYDYGYSANLFPYTYDVNGLEIGPSSTSEVSTTFEASLKLQGGGTSPNFTPPTAVDVTDRAGAVDDDRLFNQPNLIYDNSAAYANLSQLAMQQLADMRAQNGAEMSRINFAQDLLEINAVNLEAANSRIMDVDVAAESSQLARFQILQQAGTAMLAQANTSQQSLVRLLQG